MSSSTESFDTTPPLREKSPAAALFIAFAFLILFVASLQYYWPGIGWGSASTLTWQGEALTLAKGRGYNIKGELRIDGLSGAGVALAVLSPPAFRAEDYPAVHWSVSSAKPESKVEFLWRTSEKPGSIFARELKWVGHKLAPLQMSGDINWHGQITELVLMVHAPMSEPLSIDAVNIETPLGIVWREWFGVKPWMGTSIHFMGGNESRQWLAPLPFAAAALILALFGYAALWWRKSRSFNPNTIWVLVFIAWFVLDMRWQYDLWLKLGLTQQRYAGKSWEEKHLAADDGPLFALMQQVRAKLPANKQYRVFLIASTEYIRKRAAYHLYPFNVLNLSDLISPRRFKSGDFIIILEHDEVEFDNKLHLLKWAAGQQLDADLLLVAENNVLLKVR